MRKVSFVENEYYHIYNRGVDKRDVELISFNETGFSLFFVSRALFFAVYLLRFMHGKKG
jgi:hypothetical protein